MCICSDVLILINSLKYYFISVNNNVQKGSFKYLNSTFYVSNLRDNAQR